MFRIKLKEYYGVAIYMNMFDEMLKEEAAELVITKETLLKDLKINPSSYRRCKISDREASANVITRLVSHYNMKRMLQDDLLYFEEIVNDIYLDVNYKVYDKFNYYIELLDDMIANRVVLLPIVQLLRIFLDVFSKQDIEIAMGKFNKEFEEVEKYKSFFNEDILKIYDILKLVYSYRLTKSMLAKTYDEGLSYSLIALRHLKDKRYFESLYFSQKAKDIFLKENNLKRMIYVNYTILNNLSYLNNFEDYYTLAFQQLLTVRAFDKTKFEHDNALKHMVVSSIAVGKYKEAYDIIVNRKQMNMSNLAALIVARFHINSDDIDEWFEVEIKKNIKDEYKINVFYQLILYLKNSDKNILKSIQETNLIMESLINVLSST